jgi:hypothetical protein
VWPCADNTRAVASVCTKAKQECENGREQHDEGDSGERAEPHAVLHRVKEYLHQSVQPRLFRKSAQVPRHWRGRGTGTVKRRSGLGAARRIRSSHDRPPSYPRAQKERRRKKRNEDMSFNSFPFFVLRFLSFGEVPATVGSAPSSSWPLPAARLYISLRSHPEITS